jgi:hypothetical protein
VSNVLSEEKRQQVIALGQLGWPLRRIQQEIGIRRETAGAPGGWGGRAPAKPANEVSPPDLSTGAEAKLGQNRPIVSPDPAPIPLPGRCPTSSACEPYFDFIELSLGKGRNAKAIYQDLVDSHSTVSLSRRRAFRGCLHVVSCMVLLPVRTCSGEKEAEQDYYYGRAMSAYTRSLHERTRVIRG